MIKLTQLTGIIIILMTSQTLHAENFRQENVMRINPGRCVVATKGDSCQRLIDFSFHLPKSGDYCVYKNRENKPLFCFKETNFNARQHFSLTESTHFSLRDQATKIAIAEITFELLSYVPAKPRRKRKHAWGIL